MLNDFGKLCSAYVETDETEADESAVISDIISGAHSNPLRVIAFNTLEGWSRDVTEDMAQKILDLNRLGTVLSAPARDLVERILRENPVVAV